MIRPRVKPVLPPIPLGDGRIRLGTDLGIAADLQDDARGHTWHLLNLLDGTLTTAQVIESMLRFDPAVRPEEVAAAVAGLDEAGFLEDAAAEPPAVLSEAEVVRYRRNFEFFSHFHQPGTTRFDHQERLKLARVTVVGLGGLGTFTALSLAALGVGELTLVDHDVVDPSNLNRQVLYGASDIGRPKAEAAAEQLAAVNPHTAVTAHVARVAGVADARRWTTGRDLVVCAADRPRLRIYEWFNAAALAEDVPWVRAGNSGLTVSAFLHVPRETACFDCVQRTAREQSADYAAAATYIVEQLGETGVNPCTAPVAGLVGNITALEVTKQLTGAAVPAIRGRRLVLDLQRMEIEYADGIRRPDCPSCSVPADSTPGQRT
ncbi:HesA/MoeB/ThiF family protein [Kitasatospora albolonga]|uniref:HesA/MoeB/ThiF family protein n=1 Tax=Kitasatospora albolonga TaxID=68173 RepID=UPI0035E60144